MEVELLRGVELEVTPETPMLEVLESVLGSRRIFRFLDRLNKVELWNEQVSINTSAERLVFFNALKFYYGEACFIAWYIIRHEKENKQDLCYQTGNSNNRIFEVINALLFRI